MADTPDLAARMKALSDSYVSQLPDKLAQLEQAWQQLSQVVWDEQAFQAFCRTVHSLSGSGATFGLPQLSEQARVLEAYLEQMTINETGLNDEQVTHVKHAIAGFYRVVSEYAAH